MHIHPNILGVIHQEPTFTIATANRCFHTGSGIDSLHTDDVRHELDNSWHSLFRRCLLSILVDRRFTTQNEVGVEDKNRRSVGILRCVRVVGASVSGYHKPVDRGIRRESGASTLASCHAGNHWDDCDDSLLGKRVQHRVSRRKVSSSLPGGGTLAITGIHIYLLSASEELAHLMTLFTPHWQDAKLIAFDYWLTELSLHLARTVCDDSSE
jgi:hypothetical protein